MDCMVVLCHYLTCRCCYVIVIMYFHFGKLFDSNLLALHLIIILYVHVWVVVIMSNSRKIQYLHLYLCILRVSVMGFWLATSVFYVGTSLSEWNLLSADFQHCSKYLSFWWWQVAKIVVVFKSKSGF